MEGDVTEEDEDDEEQQQQHFIHSCTAYIHLNMEKELRISI